LCHILHEKCRLGSISAARVVVDLPKTGEIWCECCNGRGQTKIASAEETLLVSRKPKWNPKSQTLTLDFGGRFNQPSVKNFQLARGSCKHPSIDDVVLLFGKTGHDSFQLEFDAPLGAVQAFAIALTTRFWGRD